eukprot:TRINITY_DN105088_c0_g1_i1.p1 TRINITY_DN105088_c0_g1~~TRINITY_DN105088_c0_g1_i1.p1  ORF type:complete len:594 (+),score=98.82 TRINITY_DN105088_c0_g1_i1:28-1782(+)
MERAAKQDRLAAKRQEWGQAATRLPGNKHIPKHRSCIETELHDVNFVVGPRPEAQPRAETGGLATFMDGLARARRSSDPDEIDFVCGRAERQGVPAHITATARTEAHALRQKHAEDLLDRAFRSSLPVEMDRACAVAVERGVCDEKIKRVRVQAAELRGKAQLASAVKKGDVQKVNEIAEYAEQIGLSSEAVQHARANAKIEHAKKRLRASMLSQSPGELEASISEAVAAGLHANTISKAKHMLIRINPRSSQVESLMAQMLESLGTKDVNLIQKALNACRGQADLDEMAPLVAAAQRKLWLLEECKNIYLSTQLRDALRTEACFLVGASSRHNLAAELLGKILAPCASDSQYSSFSECLDGTSIFDPAESSVLPAGKSQTRIRGGRSHHCPTGWLRWCLRWGKPEQAEWCTAYHGTHCSKLLSILFHGLRRPGELGVRQAHGQAGSSTGRSIYLSPSVEYAAFPVYGQFFELGTNHWAQAILECCVHPSSFKEQPGTLGNKYWPRDLCFDPDQRSLRNMEWLVDDTDAVAVTAVLLREFGEAATEGPYEAIARQVCSGSRGPEFDWTERRAADFRRRALMAEA